MTNFQQITDLPILDLGNELNLLLKNNTVSWDKNNQICLNSTADNPDNFHLGTGSLIHNWDNKLIIRDEYGNEKVEVPKFEQKYNEEDFSVLCSAFKKTQFEVVYNEIKKRYSIGRIRLMKSKPKTCLSWHVDTSLRLHYPIKTQTGCFMIIDQDVKHLPLHTWWLTNTLASHTAMNASNEDRIHLVAVIF